jgi:hypothetical protein
MDFCVYLNRRVKIDVSKGYYYFGLVLSVDDEYLTLEDKNGRLVTLSIKDIVNVREVLN